MNFNNACEILGLTNCGEIDSILLKKQYRKNILLYHPDKNSDPGATDIFRKIQESYEFLLDYLGNPLDDENELEDHEMMETDNLFNYFSPTYKNILVRFLTPIMQSETFQEIKSRVFYHVLDCIASKCEEKALYMLNRLDKRVLEKTCALLHTYKDVFHIPSELLEKIDKMFTDKIQEDEYIILNPFLDDLFENHLYRLTKNGQTYLIPLWHHELVYDNSGSELFVQCCPILPDGVQIDDDNNIYIDVEYALNKIWNLDVVEINLGKHHIQISRDELMLKSKQTLRFKGEGISRISSKNIYSISRKADIYVNITIK